MTFGKGQNENLPASSNSCLQWLFDVAKVTYSQGERGFVASSRSYTSKEDDLYLCHAIIAIKIVEGALLFSENVDDNIYEV